MPNSSSARFDGLGRGWLRSKGLIGCEMEGKSQPRNARKVSGVRHVKEKRAHGIDHCAGKNGRGEPGDLCMRGIALGDRKKAIVHPQAECDHDSVEK